MGSILSGKKLYYTEENTNHYEFNGKKYIPLLEFDKLKKSKPISIKVEYNNCYKNIVIILFKEKVLAFENRCPHQHRASLHLGYVENDCITCPEHGWSFDLNSGCSVNNKLSVSKLHFLDVFVSNGIIYLNINDLVESKWNFT